ncbi:MAG: hypothetical protein AB203_02615 [Parcubacteria bacterium C7867-008]|nr:MAG: hypothetical protein AB203_02615 [Parcubacteria bacterium C7867-008]
MLAASILGRPFNYTNLFEYRPRRPGLLEAGRDLDNPSRSPILFYDEVNEADETQKSRSYARMQINEKPPYGGFSFHRSLMRAST